MNLEKNFKNRAEAGALLAQKLNHLKNQGVVVLALPRGGLPIGAAIAKKLKALLDVFIVRKIGAPFQPEFGVGAIAEDDLTIFDQQSLVLIGLTTADLAPVIQKETEELKRRQALYRAGQSLPDLKGKTILLVDDGLATGITALAAIQALKFKKPKKLILVVPVCAYDTFQKLRNQVDELIYLKISKNFGAVGEWYEEFEQLSDQEVIKILTNFKK